MTAVPTMSASMKRKLEEENASELAGAGAGLPSSSRPRPEAPPEPNLLAKLSKVARPAEGVLAHNMIMFAREPKDVMEPYPFDELKEYSGMYIKIGFLNSKPLYKSQELGGADLPFSPGKTAFLWWHSKYQHFFLSALPVDEKESPDFDNWDDLKVQGMFNADLSEGWCPWSSREPCTTVKWYSFWGYAKMMLDFTSMRLDMYLYSQRELQDADVAEEEPTEAPAASSDTPETMVVGDFGPINRPPPAQLPSIKKSGYMAKLCALMVAQDLSLDERANNVRQNIFESTLFTKLYKDHVDMLERTGEDHRYNFVPGS